MAWTSSQSFEEHVGVAAGGDQVGPGAEFGGVVLDELPSPCRECRGRRRGGSPARSILPECRRSVAASVDERQAGRSCRGARRAAWRTPGAIAPPRNSPASLQTLTVMAVPASTTTHALPICSYAAATFSTRSTPVCSGCSVVTLIGKFEVLADPHDAAAAVACRRPGNRGRPSPG